MTAPVSCLPSDLFIEISSDLNSHFDESDIKRLAVINCRRKVHLRLPHKKNSTTELNVVLEALLMLSGS